MSFISAMAYQPQEPCVNPCLVYTALGGTVYLGGAAGLGSSAMHYGCGIFSIGSAAGCGMGIGAGVLLGLLLRS